ncbi:fumarylacetoacetate hydrolase family protein [Sulfitobacter sp. F26204]|uniref:fumarylacetoacetate hydrolase family protein n=1 Tax=Sulfitobacter sp. F26204 TaxID=2996014 RepID=UPI00225E49B2|nr:fumarylacetoacetate hydrolase family protein [Sulfitobacter sp. F26204]MCX7561222.1 fumarylacetoacetate hydrolase family protein [Sulfitobacter sp. F26204]
MKLVTYKIDVESAGRLGVIQDGLVVDVAGFGETAGLDFPHRMLDFIDLGPVALRQLREALDLAGGEWGNALALPLETVTLLAPIPRPRKNIFGIGLNYLDHITESAKALDTDDALPKEPVVFSKPPTAVVGPGDAVHHDGDMTQQLDWEVELAVIIGTTARRVARENALKHVFGYSVMIDVSARDNRRAGQWIFSKGMDTYAPFGPCIVTADDIPDPQKLDLWLTVNGVEKQSSNTAKMLFKVDELISDLSKGITLEPGDIIASGTPEGVGAGRDPQEWLWPGDVMEAHVEGIGTIRHPVINAVQFK